MIDISGERFGKLVVLRYSHTKNNRAYWKCKCDCGKEKTIAGTSLRCSYTKSCGCSRRGQRPVKKEYDLTGKRFHNLLVEKRDPLTRGEETKWICICDCGNRRTIRRSELINNIRKSCGCLHNRRGSDHPNWRGYKEIPLSVWNSFKQGCNRKSRELEFDISIEYAWRLFEKQNRKCALSGVEIKFEGYINDFKNTTASLDRIDSSIGYVRGNIQWVHKTIQTMKWNLNQTEFIRFCTFVSEHKGK